MSVAAFVAEAEISFGDSYCFHKNVYFDGMEVELEKSCEHFILQRIHMVMVLPRVSSILRTRVSESWSWFQRSVHYYNERHLFYKFPIDCGGVVMILF